MNDIKIQQKFIDSEMGKIFTQAWIVTNSDLAPIILFHESLGSVKQWKNFPEQLAVATQRTVIAYDRIGFGQSEGETKLLNVDFLDDEASITFPLIIDTYQLKTFTVFGHSIGGGFAAGCALRYPKCLALMIESSLGYIDEKTIQGVKFAKSAFQAPQFFSRLTHYHGEKAQSVLDAWTDSWLSDSFELWSILEELAKIKCPMLVIHGEDDEYGEVKQAEAIVHAATAQCELHVLKGCGHLPHHEQMETVIQHIQVFLKNID